MSDYYPSIRTIVAIFYFAFWYFKEVQPFNIWWLVLIFGIDYIIALFILSFTKKYLKNKDG